MTKKKETKENIELKNTLIVLTVIFGLLFIATAAYRYWLLLGFVSLMLIILLWALVNVTRAKNLFTE
jgi:uncharacterized membrane protein